LALTNKIKYLNYEPLHANLISLYPKFGTVLPNFTVPEIWNSFAKRQLYLLQQVSFLCVSESGVYLTLIRPHPGRYPPTPLGN